MAKPGTSRELTESVHAPQEGDPTTDPVYQRARSRILRVGNAFFIVISLLIFIPMLIGVLQGIMNRRVWDPYTEQLVYEHEEGSRCVEEARRMLVEAGRAQGVSPRWSESLSAWQTRCTDQHPDMYEALNRTRERLTKNQQP